MGKKVDVRPGADLYGLIMSDYKRGQGLRTEIARMEVETAQGSSFSGTETHEKEVSECYVDHDFEKMVEDIISSYKKLGDNFSVDDLKLPDRNHGTYALIIYRLQAESLKAINECRKMLLEENLDSEEVDFLKEWILQEERKIEKLNQFLEKEEDTCDVIKEKNKVIMIPNPDGKISFIDSINHLPCEIYGDILGLIKSIIDGTFKRGKKYSSDRKILSVRKGDLRVYYGKLTDDIYVLISAYVKKEYTSSLYREMLDNLSNIYTSNIDMLLSLINNPEFMTEMEFHVAELFRILGSDEDFITYIKGGRHE